MSESIVTKRIKHLLDYFDISISELGRRIGVNQSNLSQILKGNRPCGEAIINKIVIGMGINKEWLLGADIPMLDVCAFANGPDMVPELPLDAIGGSTDEINSVMLGNCQMLPRIPGLPNYEMTVPVRGDSMSPTFESGDRLAIRKCFDIVQWGAPHVIDTTEGPYLKRIREEGDHIVCLSDNPAYPPFNIPKAAIRNIYKVIAILRVL